MLPTIASISHIRSPQSQYINHINQSYQKPPGSIRQSHQSVISETTSVNTSITSIYYNRSHQFIITEDKCKLEGFFVPFGHRDGKCIFIEIYIYIGYMLPTIASISHIRSPQSQYINHINQSYQKPPGSIRQSHQSVISETTSVNTSITSIYYNRKHQSQYIDHINR